MQLEKYSATELGKLVNSKQISPVEVIQYFIERIEKRNPAINAFTYTKFDEALDEAKDQENRILNGEYIGPFAGVPIGLKDFLPSKKGWTNSHGGVPSLVRADSEDSEFYKAASSLGAIAIGKTNAPAFGFSGACSNKMYGATRNPFCHDRTSGGSSGGSAAAVADGLLGLSEGGDAGGSIRIPSGWCNLFGFKASVGTVPSICRPDAWTATHPYCCNGGLTRTVEDSAILWNRMARYDPRDPCSLPINSMKDFNVLKNIPIKGMKIAYTDTFGDLFSIDKEVQSVVEKSVKKLEESGAHVDLVPFSFKFKLDEIARCWAWAISIDTALDLMLWKMNGGPDLWGECREEVPEEFLHFNNIAYNAGIWKFRLFNEIRTDILDNFENAFENYDVIVSPTAICKPMLISDEGRCKEVDTLLGPVKLDPETSFINFAETMLVNFVGYPAASIPAGLTSEGLPVGMHVIGKQYCDEDVFRVARTSEEINPWYQNYLFMK